MSVGGGLSTTPETALAAMEAAEAAARTLAGEGQTLAVVFATPDHLDGTADLVAAVEAHLQPDAMIGALAQGVVGPGREIESGPAVAVWALRIPEGQIHPFRSWAMPQDAGGMVVAGWPDTHPDDLTLLLADPFSYPAHQVVARLGEARPSHRVVGGLVTGGPGATRLLLGDRVHEDGAVGVVLRDLDVDAVVSQGCRPVGAPLTVTRAEGNVILELAGEPATEALQHLFAAAPEGDRALMQSGLHLGIVADEYREEHGTGDFLIRGVLGADPDTGGIAVGDVVPLGRTVQFQVRDASSAAADLAEQLGADPGPVAGSLLFTCNGRGARFFGEPDHDVKAVEANLGGHVVGAFCAGEIGPVGDRSFLHGFTASLAVFRDGA